MDIQLFEERKRDHIRFALDPVNEALGLSGLENMRLHHDALPEMDFEEVSLHSHTLGHALRAPLFVAGMTAGHKDAAFLNQRLARMCATRGWAMGVGSQRRELHGEVIDNWKALRQELPGLVLFANLGISQIRQATVEQVERVVDSIRANALCIHLNALQECMQPEGTPQFRGGIEKVAELSQKLSVPVVLKETGCGFSPRTLERVSHFPIRAVDISGLGGTHWGRIEGSRAELQNPQKAGAPVDAMRARAARIFADWGETTVESVQAASKILPSRMEIWATGGVRSGLDAAKLIALGAHMVGYAKPALEAALESEAALELWMQSQEFELKTALFCSGHQTPQQLRERGTKPENGVWSVRR
jgi:isopentenyl-diphosphate delta-isomerase